MDLLKHNVAVGIASSVSVVLFLEGLTFMPVVAMVAVLAYAACRDAYNNYPAGNQINLPMLAAAIGAAVLASQWSQAHFVLGYSRLGQEVATNAMGIAAAAMTVPFTALWGYVISQWITSSRGNRSAEFRIANIAAMVCTYILAAMVSALGPGPVTAPAITAQSVSVTALCTLGAFAMVVGPFAATPDTRPLLRVATPT